MDHWDWPGVQWRAECQVCRCTRLTACFSQTVKPLKKAYFYYICFLNDPFFFKIVYYYVDKTIFVNMSYFLKLLFCRKTLVNDSTRSLIIIGRMKLIELWIEEMYSVFCHHFDGRVWNFQFQNGWYLIRNRITHLKFHVHACMSRHVHCWNLYCNFHCRKWQI